jgi:hypothetical protein
MCSCTIFYLNVLNECDNSFLQCAGGYSDGESSSFGIVPYVPDTATKLQVVEYGAPCERRQVGSHCLLHPISRCLDSIYLYIRLFNDSFNYSYEPHSG